MRFGYPNLFNTKHVRIFCYFGLDSVQFFFGQVRIRVWLSDKMSSPILKCFRIFSDFTIPNLGLFRSCPLFLISFFLFFLSVHFHNINICFTYLTKTTPMNHQNIIILSPVNRKIDVIPPNLV